VSGYLRELEFHADTKMIFICTVGIAVIHKTKKNKKTARLAKVIKEEKQQ
jgi:hypothetical protein